MDIDFAFTMPDLNQERKQWLGWKLSPGEKWLPGEKQVAGLPSSLAGYGRSLRDIEQVFRMPKQELMATRLLRACVTVGVMTPDVIRGKTEITTVA